MASKTTTAKCLAIIRKLKGQEWDPGPDGDDLYYGQVFLQLPDDLALEVAVYAADHCDWRPSRAELWRIVTKKAAPVLSAEEAFRLLYRMMGERGIYGYRKPGTNIWLAEDPDDWPHPLIGETVEALGGWLSIFPDKTPAGVLRKQFRETYDALVEGWREQVRECVMLPRSRWPERLQAACPSLIAADEPKMLTAAPEPEGELIPMPEYIRDAFRLLGLEVGEMEESDMEMEAV